MSFAAGAKVTLALCRSGLSARHPRWCLHERHDGLEADVRGIAARPKSVEIVKIFWQGLRLPVGHSRLPSLSTTSNGLRITTIGNSSCGQPSLCHGGRCRFGKDNIARKGSGANRTHAGCVAAPKRTASRDIWQGRSVRSLREIALELVERYLQVALSVRFGFGQTTAANVDL